MSQSPSNPAETAATLDRRTDTESAGNIEAATSPHQMGQTIPAVRAIGLSAGITAARPLTGGHGDTCNNPSIHRRPPPIAERLSDMHAPDILRTRQIGDRPADP